MASSTPDSAHCGPGSFQIRGRCRRRQVPLLVLGTLARLLLVKAVPKADGRQHCRAADPIPTCSTTRPARQTRGCGRARRAPWALGGNFCTPRADSRIPRPHASNDLPPKRTMGPALIMTHIAKREGYSQRMEMSSRDATRVTGVVDHLRFAHSPPRSRAQVIATNNANEQDARAGLARA